MRKLLVVNLVLSGLILGFVLSMTLVSCSTQVEPTSRVPAQDRPSVQSDPEALQSSFREVASTALPSVVRIDVEEVRRQDSPNGDDQPWFDFFFGEPDSDEPDREGREFRSQGLGSGVIVRRDGDRYYVMTNDHVIGNADEITITLDDGSDYPAEIVGKDARKDLAMVSFTSEADIPVARIGDSDELQVGDWVMAIGSPFGFQSTVTVGIVSALERRGGPAGNISDFIQTDAAINRGNSGGALVNLAGELVGINTWITSQTGGSMGLGFSIPVDNVVRSIDDFIETGAVRYGWLGVSIRSVTDELANSLGLPDRRGALVHHVFLDSPADNGGLLPGDFVRVINGITVEDSDELVLEVGELPVDEEATFEIVRSGEEMTITVRIGERESETAIANLNARLWPGFSVFPLTDELRADIELDSAQAGVLVSTVENRTPGAAAGFRVGDVLTAINGTATPELLDFYRELNDAGNTMEVTILRDGTEQTLQLTQ
ncbi:MAG TPA: Do family serine endopeptidase [Alkalispirochaeta sp.]|nr:Do family serine endopeptidase [Alkalispirochaeta sp.]